MINKKESLLSKRLARTIRSSRRNEGRREISLHFSDTFLKDNHILESIEWLRLVGKGQGRHPFNVGVVKETTSIEIVLTKMRK
jgi:hypothetical protein